MRIEDDESDVGYVSYNLKTTFELGMGSSFEVVKMEEDGEAYTDDEISTMLSYLEISE